jgi:formate-dependent nitrite reductase membrane component NrfD
MSAEPTYYDQPVIKGPVWIWAVPVYFYVGGVAGAAMVLGYAAEIAGGKSLRNFAARCRWTGAIAGGVGTALLVYDLGRRERFLAMLRVFRPTSPMSVGSWLLALAGPMAATSVLFPEFGAIPGIISGILGMPLAGYTAVLLSNTAVPVWRQSRRSLPVLFAASSMVSVASLFKLMALRPEEDAIVNRFGIVGMVAELAAGRALEREVSRVPHVGKPYREGASGALWTAAKVLTAATLVVSLAPGRSTAKRRRIAGVLGTLGGMCLRWAVFQAGKRSAADPRATFRQQRAGYGADSAIGGAVFAVYTEPWASLEAWLP